MSESGTEFQFEGKRSDVNKLRAEFLAEAAKSEFTVSEMKEAKPDPLERPRQGLEPLVYFGVIVAGHLTADAIKALAKVLAEKAKKLNVRFKKK